MSYFGQVIKEVYSHVQDMIIGKVIEDGKTAREQKEQVKQELENENFREDLKKFIENDIPIPSALKKSHPFLTAQTCVNAGKGYLVEDLLPWYTQEIKKNKRVTIMDILKALPALLGCLLMICFCLIIVYLLVIVIFHG